MIHMTIICICGADQSLNASKPHLEPMVPWDRVRGGVFQLVERNPQKVFL